jgi:hypothetical protein
VKRFIVWALIIGVLALAVLVFFWCRPLSPSATPGSSLANLPAGKIQPEKPAAAALQTNRPVALPASVAAAQLEPAPALAAFGNFSRWVELFTNSSASLVEGERLAWKRREAMLDLIQNDPKKAIELSMPFELRQSLPPQITKFFEQQVDGRGDFLLAVGTDFSNGNMTTYRQVQLGGKNYQAFVYGRRRSQVSQTAIPLHGIALDGKMAVSAESLRALSVAEATALDKNAVKPDVICSVSGAAANSRGQPVYAESGGGVMAFCGADHFNLVNQQWAAAEGNVSALGSANSSAVATSANDNWTHGRKSVLYMRVNFPDDLTEPVSEADAYATMNGVNSFYTEGSYDLTSLTATVTPLLTLPQTKAYYSADPGTLINDARQAARAAGFETANYPLDLVAFTTVPGYSWSGLAAVHGKSLWLNNCGASVGVAAHEFGHNYGLLHANFWNAVTNFSMIGPGTNLEYGNIFDTMGLAGAGNYQFNANHKNLLDWLKADAIQNLTSNGVYRIYPFDVPGSLRATGRIYAAFVKKDSQRDYWLEFRQKFTGNPWFENGLSLNWAAWDESSGGTQLIDTTPGSPDAGDGLSRDDAAVVIGRTYNDNAAGVHITPLLRGSTGSDPWIDYQVNLGAFPGNQPPVLAVEVDNTKVAPGALVHFHATATDPDGDTLAYAWTFDDLTFSTNNLPWTSKIFSTPGDHVVRCVVSDMKGGVASANAVVSAGTSTGYRLSGRVTEANGVPLEGVLVGNGEIDASTFIGGWTDSDGRYILVNVATNFNLNAFQFGYTFANLTWSNPVQPTNEMVNLDFVATPLPAVNITVDTNAVAENDGSAHIFTVTRTGSVSNDLSVNIVLTGTATPGSDYTLDTDLTVTNVITIPAGTNRFTFVFHAINDTKIEGPETVTLTLLDDDANMNNPNYAIAPLAEATITILDDDSPVTPTVTVATTTPEISENGIDNGQFTFTRNGGTQNDLLVYYSTGGTATSGVDYAALPNVVLIPAGQRSTTIPLVPIDDKNVEPDETVIATITANAAYTVGSPAAATITILDDDFMTVTVSTTGGNAAEPSTPGTFTVQRDGDLTEALVVNYNLGGSASNGVDYVALSGTLTIPAGAPSADITITPIDDPLIEGDKSVIISITNSLNYDVGTPGSASLVIREDENPTVSIQTTVDNVSEQGDVPGQITVTRTGSSGDLVVYLAVSGTADSGVDYVPVDNPVVIPDGSSSVTIDVIPFHDLILEPTETVILTLQTNANYYVGSPATARLKILDDGTSKIPGIGFCFATSAIVESQSPGIAVRLSQTSSVPVQVSYRVIGGTAPASRYSLPQGTVVIPSNSWVAFVPLQIVNDSVVEPPQTIRVALFNPTNATLDGIKIHTYTILDDDACSVSVTATAPNAAETGTIAGNFRITRAGSTNASQLVNFQITGTASAPTDYAPLGNSATIPAGATFVDLPVVPTDDNTVEFSQTVVLTLTSATNANIISPNVATVTIADNDTNTLPVVTVTSTNHPYAVEGGGNGEFLFTRTGATTNALTISFTTGGTAGAGTRYVVLPNSVTIPVGQTSVSLPVAAIDDTLVEGEQTVVVSLTEGNSYRTAYPAFATVTIQDNDQRVWIDASDFRASKYGSDPGQFTFSRFGTTNMPVTIFYAISGTASNGVDYVRITNSIVIPAGQLTVTLPILPLHNGVVKGPVTATLTLLTNAAFVLGTPTNGTVTIDDDMPMLTISAVVTNVLEGTGSNGVFRVTRTGDPQYDFTAYLAVGGTATFGVDYPPFATNIYFTCGVISIDLFVTPTNEVVVEGDETVTAALLPDPAYTVLSPSNAVLTIADAGTNQTPVVIITSPKTYVVFVNGTHAGLVLNATVIDEVPTNDVLTWSKVSGPDSYIFGDPTTNNTTVLFTNAGVYLLRLTADDGQLQGHADILVFVSSDVLSATNILHWTLDEGSGTNVADTSGNGRDGIFSGLPVWTTNGAIAGALQFSGTNDYVRQSAGSNTLNGLNAFTVSLWLKPSPTNSDCGFLTGDDSGTNTTFSLATKNIASCGNATNVVEATIPTTSGVMHRTSASNALQPGQWQHVALTWTNGEAPKLYLNGQLDQPLAGFLAASGVLTNCPQFIVGKGAFDSPASWNGAIDDVRVFAVALSAGEILALADGPVTNHAPVVDAGTNVTVQIGIAVTLVGTVTDDGLPNPPGFVTSTWTYLGTNSVTIPDPASLTNTFVFTTPGDYVFRLTAFDGELTSFADVTVTVLELTTVDVSASIGDAYELGPVSGEFTFTRTGDTNELTVYLAISGIASNSVDYVTLTNAVTFAAGSNSIALPVTPFLDYAIEGDESVIVTILTNIAYSVGNAQATVTIHDSPYGQWSLPPRFSIQDLTQPELSGPGADFDHDGIVNFAEYAFNLDPKVPDAAPCAWDFETSTNDNRLHLTLTYTRRLPPRDVEYGVYVSTNLFNWNTGTNFVEEFLHTNDLNGFTETVKTRALMPYPGPTRLFMNIRVWLQQVPAPAP